MATVLLPITPLNLPPNYCYPATPQELLIAFAAALKAVGPPGFMYYNYGDTEPDPEYQAYPWLRTVDDRWYHYDGGWISRHPIAASSKIRWFWAGTTGDLQTFDGGDANPASDRSGPMWEIDTPEVGRSFIAPGLVPGSDPAVTLAVDDTAGTGSQLINKAQLPGHQHIIPICARTAQVTDPEPGVSPASVQYGIGKTQGTGNVVDDSSGSYPRAFPLTSEKDVEDPPGQERLSILSPVIARYPIKRTSRIYYTA